MIYVEVLSKQLITLLGKGRVTLKLHEPSLRAMPVSSEVHVDMPFQFNESLLDAAASENGLEAIKHHVASGTKVYSFVVKGDPRPTPSIGMYQDSKGVKFIVTGHEREIEHRAKIVKFFKMLRDNTN